MKTNFSIIILIIIAFQNVLFINCENLKSKDLISKVFLKSKAFNYCKIFKIDYPEKKHVVKIESIFRPYKSQKASRFIQHLVLWVCKHPDPEIFERHSRSSGIDCTNLNYLPNDYRHCFNLFFNLENPDTVFETGDGNAIAIGDQFSRYLMLNTHIEVAKEGFVGQELEIGMRLWYTDSYRRNELQQLITGAHLSMYGIMIPPRRHRFTNVGHCSGQCFKDLMPSEGITLTHVSPQFLEYGRKIITRHFRGNQELDRIIDTGNNGNDSLSFKKLKRDIRVLPNDIITTECTYDSSLANRTLLADAYDLLDEEMCLTLFMYYPRIYKNKVLPQTCFSGLSEQDLLKAADVKGDISGYWYTNQPQIVGQSRKLSTHLYSKRDWRDDIQELLQYSKKRIRCSMFESRDDDDYRPIQYVNYPNKFIPDHLVDRYGNHSDSSNRSRDRKDWDRDRDWSRDRDRDWGRDRDSSDRYAPADRYDSNRKYKTDRESDRYKDRDSYRDNDTIKDKSVNLPYGSSKYDKYDNDRSSRRYRDSHDSYSDRNRSSQRNSRDSSQESDRLYRERLYRGGYDSYYNDSKRSPLGNRDRDRNREMDRDKDRDLDIDRDRYYERDGIRDRDRDRSDSFFRDSRYDDSDSSRGGDYDRDRDREYRDRDRDRDRLSSRDSYRDKEKRW